MMRPGVYVRAVVFLMLVLLCGAGYSTGGPDENVSGNPYSGKTVADIEKADGSGPGAKGAGATPGLPGAGPVIRMLVYLAVVVVCIYAVVYFIRRYVPSARYMFGSGVLKVVGRTYVSSKQSILLIKVGSRFVVVGVTGATITPLAEISDAEEVRRLTEELTAQGGRKSADSFKKALTDADKDYAGREEASKPENPGESALSDVRQELDALRNKVNWWRRRAKE